MPVIEHLGPDAAITLDSGGLHDSTDAATGRGVSRLRIEFAVIDHDDDATMHLFYSDNPNLEVRDNAADDRRRPPGSSSMAGMHRPTHLRVAR